jgi:hypothetical protein
MNKKAQQKNIGSVVVLIFIASFLFLAGFLGYLSLLDDNSVSMDNEIDLTKIQVTFNESKNISNTIQNGSKALPGFLNNFDFLSVGYDSLKSLLDAPALFVNIVSFIKENSFFRLLPEQFWGTIVGIIVSIIVLLALSAFWRYRFA